MLPKVIGIAGVADRGIVGLLWRLERASGYCSPWRSDQQSGPAVYHLKGTPARFVGLVHNQPDEESTIKAAIEEYEVPPNQRGRLMAQRRD
jgi:hypothetical protein